MTQPRKRRASGPSGPTQTAEQRRAAGRVRLSTWLPAEAAADLDELRDVWGTTIVETITRAIREALRAATGLSRHE